MAVSLVAKTPSPAAVFLDKDGTLVEDVPYNVDVDRIRFYPDAGEALRGFAALGYRLIVVSNQPGVAKGYFEEQALSAVRNVLSDYFAQAEAVLTDFIYCPHHPHGGVHAYARDCDCRKPRSGMLRRAAVEYGLDLAQCWMIGDILNDIEAGNQAGCRSVLVDRGNETEWLCGPGREPETTVSSLVGALAYVAAQTAIAPAGARA